MTDGSGGSGRPPSETDAIWRRAEIASPCIKICVLHPQARICVGCFRTGDEIGAWSRLSPQMREAIMAELPAREAVLTRRGGAGTAGRRRSRDRGGPTDG